MIIYVTDPNKFSNEKSFLENIKLSSLYGIEFIQIRLKSLDQKSKTDLTVKIKNIIDTRKTRIIINSDFISSKLISPFGFHITSQSNTSGADAKMKSGAKWISKSIHSREEIVSNNEDKNINAFIIGTIYSSNSHPNGKTLGIEKFNELVKLSKKPVIGIGGINIENISHVVKAGAKGAALISDLAFSSDLQKSISKLKKYYE